MSSVDNRIVRMQFDNAQFESGVKTSTKSLENLKKGLNLDEAAKSLSNLNEVGKSFSLSSIAAGVEGLGRKFSALGIIGITALQNITNSAINTGKQLVSSLTIAPISDGLSEYERKIGSIQTILANTAKYGTSLNDVTKNLSELNAYSDQTIYNFGDMTKSIGLFTNAGINLQDATAMVKGFSNEAAVSGASAQQAANAEIQLSQALSAGTVKAMDWFSITNAGMGNDNMKRGLVEIADAMGTLNKKSGDSKAILKDFKGSLDSGWLTSSVMANYLKIQAGELTDQQMKAIGLTQAQIDKFKTQQKTAQEAATKVRTFTQLIGTLQESVGSNWAQTFEDVIGNFDEATALWTSVNNVLGNMITAAGNARHALLQSWKDLGGRNALINGLANSFHNLEAIVIPIQKAFREIFPPITAQQLVAFSKGFEALTEKLKIADSTSKNIQRTFAGLFAVLDIVWQALSAVGNLIAKVFGAMARLIFPAADGVLSVTGGIGDYLVALDKALKSSDFFNKQIAKFIDWLKVLAASIKAAAEPIEKVLTPAVDAIKKKITDIVDSFQGMGNANTSGVATYAANVQKGLSPLTTIGEGIATVFKEIQSVFQKLEPYFKAVGDAVGKALSKVGTASSEALKNGDFQKLMNLFMSGTFAAVLIAVTRMISSFKKVADNAGSFIESITGILDSVRDCLKTYQTQIKADAIKKIAISIAILAASLVVLSMIDPEKLTKALIAMSVLIGEIFGGLAIFKKAVGDTDFANINKLTLTMIGLSVAINILAIAVEKLGSMDTGDLVKGVTAVTAILVALGVFAEKADFKNLSLKKTSGLTVLAWSVLQIAGAVEKFGKMDTNQLVQGLTSVIIVLSVLAGFTQVTGDAKGMLSTSVGLIAVAAAMAILAQVIQVMGSMPLDTLAQGLIGLGGALSIIAIGLQAMKGTAAASGSLLVAAMAITVLAGALKILGSMSLTSIIKGLGTVAATFAIFGVAALILTPLVPVMYALAGAVALLGVGFLSLGIGMVSLSAGLATMAVSGLAGFAALTAGLALLLNLLPLLGQKLAEAFVSFLAVIAQNGPTIVTAFTVMITSFVLAFTNSIPIMVNAVIQMIMSILTAIDENLPKIIQKGADILVGFLEGIANNIGRVASAATDVITAFIAAIGDNTLRIINAAADMVIKFINGLADTIRTRTPQLVDAVNNLMQAALEAAVYVLTGGKVNIMGKGKDLMDSLVNGAREKIGGMWNAAKDAIEGFVNGIKDGFNKVKDAAGNLGSKALNALRSALKEHSPSKETATVGGYFVEGFTNGIKALASSVASTAKDVGTTAVDTLTSAVSAISDAVSTDVDAQPTIRPVLDLTDVETGSDQINAMLAQSASIGVGTSAAMAAKAQTTQNSQNGSQLNDTFEALYDKLKTALDKLQDSVPQINFNGQYSFSNKDDIDYFMNQAGLLINRRK